MEYFEEEEEKQKYLHAVSLKVKTACHIPGRCLGDLHFAGELFSKHPKAFRHINKLAAVKMLCAHPCTVRYIPDDHRRRKNIGFAIAFGALKDSKYLRYLKQVLLQNERWLRCALRINPEVWHFANSGGRNTEHNNAGAKRIVQAAHHPTVLRAYVEKWPQLAAERFNDGMWDVLVNATKSKCIWLWLYFHLPHVLHALNPEAYAWAHDENQAVIVHAILDRKLVPRMRNQDIRDTRAAKTPRRRFITFGLKGSCET